MLSAAQDLAKGPLIVHDCSDPERQRLVDEIHAGLHDPLAYADERILFLSDVFHESAHSDYLAALGGLIPTPSKDRDTLGVGTKQWEGGLVNGQPRTVITAPLGQKVLVRVINAASVFSFKVGIDQLRFSIVGTDGSPTEPFEVDQVILSSAERVDVVVAISAQEFVVGDTLWIRAETLENRDQGYAEHHILAVLVVTDPDQHLAEIPEPAAPTSQPVADPTVLNCYRYDGSTSERCLPITALAAAAAARPSAEAEAVLQRAPLDIHTLDFRFQPPPFFAHFVAHNGGPFKQHVQPRGPPMIDAAFEPEQHLHANSVVVDLEGGATVVMVLRTATRFAHPMHLHGHRFEVLAVAAPDLERECSLVRCPLSEAFSAPGALAELAATPRTAVLKDSVLLPGGGAAVIRFQADNPGVWLGHCHISMHFEDGMGFILREGDFRGLPALPPDMPQCDAPFALVHQPPPACECYDDRDAVLDLRLTDQFRCSRPHLCRHELSTTARLHRFVHPPGVQSHRSLGMPGWAIALIGAVVVLVSFKLLQIVARSMAGSVQQEPAQPEAEGGGRMREERSSSSAEAKAEAGRGGCGLGGMWEQVSGVVQAELEENLPQCINGYRLVEVLGLAVITGFVFWEVGKDNSNRGLRESISLLFFSVTLWTFNRMYPAVVMYSVFRERLVTQLAAGEDPGPLWAQVVGRGVVYTLLEAGFPMLFGVVALPMACVVGDPVAWLEHTLLLALNALSYIFIGAAVGVFVPRAPIGMIVATLISQTTLVCAGFYVSLSPALKWVRYISPVFYTFSGMVKGAYRSEDSFECTNGDAFLGPNLCFLEFSGSIEDLKQRGINVATYGDGGSRRVWPNLLILAVYCLALQLVIWLGLRLWGASLRSKALGALALRLGGDLTEEEGAGLGTASQRSALGEGTPRHGGGGIGNGHAPTVTAELEAGLQRIMSGEPMEVDAGRARQSASLRQVHQAFQGRGSGEEGWRGSGEEGGGVSPSTAGGGSGYRQWGSMRRRGSGLSAGATSQGSGASLRRTGSRASDWTREWVRLTRVTSASRPRSASSRRASFSRPDTSLPSPLAAGQAGPRAGGGGWARSLVNTVRRLPSSQASFTSETASLGDRPTSLTSSLPGFELLASAVGFRKGREGAAAGRTESGAGEPGEGEGVAGLGQISEGKESACTSPMASFRRSTNASARTLPHASTSGRLHPSAASPAANSSAKLLRSDAPQPLPPPSQSPLAPASRPPAPASPRHPLQRQPRRLSLPPLSTPDPLPSAALAVDALRTPPSETPPCSPLGASSPARTLSGALSASTNRQHASSAPRLLEPSSAPASHAPPLLPPPPHPRRLHSPALLAAGARSSSDAAGSFAAPLRSHSSCQSSLLVAPTPSEAMSECEAAAAPRDCGVFLAVTSVTPQ